MIKCHNCGKNVEASQVKCPDCVEVQDFLDIFVARLVCFTMGVFSGLLIAAVLSTVAAKIIY